MKVLPWKEGERKLLCSTRIGRIISSERTAADGTKGEYIILDFPDWAIVIPELEDGEKFLVVDQWRHGSKEYSREFPGGVIDDGETPEEGALRELREETGCTAKELISLGSMYPNPATQSNKVHFFLARGLEKAGEQKLDFDEFVNCAEVTREELLNKNGQPPYTHGLMNSAFCCYMLFREQERRHK